MNNTDYKDFPQNLKNKSSSELSELSFMLRDFLIKNIAHTGGHLASNLGVVELTLALHKVFDTARDKIVWDVGHQTYIHKILTGRGGDFGSLRTSGGISGFPKTEESEHDHFNTGHSATSVSAALGLARARDLKNESYSVVAVIGDGALTGGMAFEALNDAGQSDSNLIVIINDNEMSISKNVGALSKHMQSLRTKTSYTHAKSLVERALKATPLIGRPAYNLLERIKTSFRYFWMKGSFFEMLGFKYFGIIDGHNIKELVSALNHAKTIKGPVILHVATTKGKGYKFAEEKPAIYHGISSFDVEKGIGESARKTYSGVMGSTITSLAEKNGKIAAITAAMPESTGLSEFASKFKNRFFDVGIAEQHAVTCAAGLAKGGFLPVVAIYSSFLQRAFDQIWHDVCLQGLRVIFMVDRAGIVGEDGETHQGVYDLSYLRLMPGMEVFAPTDFYSLVKTTEYAVNSASGPVAVRYPRGGEDIAISHSAGFDVKKAEIIKKGTDVIIIGIGKMASVAVCAAEILEKSGIDAKLLCLHCVCPIDYSSLLKEAERIKKIVTIEDNVLSGGVGMEIKATLKNADVLNIGFENEPLKQGKTEEIYKKYKMDAASVAEKIQEEFFGE